MDIVFESIPSLTLKRLMRALVTIHRSDISKRGQLESISEKSLDT